MVVRIWECPIAKILECTDGPWFTTMEFEAKHLQRRPSSGLREGLVNQELLLKNDYLLAENRILKPICSQESSSKSGVKPPSFLAPTVEQPAGTSGTSAETHHSVRC